jgi:hypothetical protein
MAGREIHRVTAVLLACACLAACESAEAKRQAAEKAAADSAEAARLRRNEAAEARAADLRAERAQRNAERDAQRQRDKQLRDAMHSPVDKFEGSKSPP